MDKRLATYVRRFALVVGAYLIICVIHVAVAISTTYGGGDERGALESPYPGGSRTCGVILGHFPSGPPLWVACPKMGPAYGPHRPHNFVIIFSGRSDRLTRSASFSGSSCDGVFSPPLIIVIQPIKH